MQRPSPSSSLRGVALPGRAPARSGVGAGCVCVSGSVRLRGVIIPVIPWPSAVQIRGFERHRARVWMPWLCLILRPGVMFGLDRAVSCVRPGVCGKALPRRRPWSLLPSFCACRCVLPRSGPPRGSLPGPSGPVGVPARWRFSSCFRPLRGGVGRVVGSL